MSLPGNLQTDFAFVRFNSLYLCRKPPEKKRGKNVGHHNFANFLKYKTLLFGRCLFCLIFYCFINKKLKDQILYYIYKCRDS